MVLGSHGAVYTANTSTGTKPPDPKPPVTPAGAFPPNATLHVTPSPPPPASVFDRMIETNLEAERVAGEKTLAFGNNAVASLASGMKSVGSNALDLVPKWKWPFPDLNDLKFPAIPSIPDLGITKAADTIKDGFQSLGTTLMFIGGAWVAVKLFSAYNTVKLLK